MKGRGRMLYARTRQVVDAGFSRALGKQAALLDQRVKVALKRAA